MAVARTIRGLAPVAVTNRKVGRCRTILVLNPKERNHTSVAGMRRAVLAIDSDKRVELGLLKAA